MAYDTAAIRDLLTAAFSDEDLATFCYDRFRPVSERFTAGMTKGQMIQLLLDHCERRDEVDHLLHLVEQANPVQYKRYTDRISAIGRSAEPGVKPGPATEPPPSGCVWSLVAKGKRLKIEAKVMVILVAAVITCVGTVLGGTAVGEVVKVLLARPTSTVSVVVVSSPSPAVTTAAIATLMTTPTATPQCPVMAATDEETIKALILAEADRVLEQDLEGVVALFDENALKWDKARNQSWQSKGQIRQYYEDAWQDIVYTQVLHTKIVITVTGTTATARSDSSGTFINRQTGEIGSWDNPRGDSWTFVKGTDGCWLISSHRFNLSPDDP